MSKKTSLTWIISAAFVIVLAALLLTSPGEKAAGAVYNGPQKFTGDVYQGYNEVLMMQNGAIVGPISSSNTFAVSGTSTFSGPVIMSAALTQSAASAFSGTSIFSAPVTISSTTLITAAAGSVTIRVPITATSTFGVTGLATFNGGFTSNASSLFTSGVTIRAALVATSTLDVTGLTTATGGILIGSGGTAISNYKCATSTWDPGSLGTSTVALAATSTDIAISGAVMGDTCSGSLTSATTSAASVNCSITGTATATIRVINLADAALDLGSGTAKVCYTH